MRLYGAHLSKGAEALETRGIAMSVIDAYALPMETGPMLRLAREQEGGIILTVEDRAMPAASAANAPRPPPTPHLSVDDVARTAVSLVQKG